MEHPFALSYAIAGTIELGTGKLPDLLNLPSVQRTFVFYRSLISYGNTLGYGSRPFKILLSFPSGEIASGMWTILHPLP